MVAKSSDGETPLLGERLRKLFSRDTPTDAAARAAIDQMDDANRRIKAVREEVDRGIRRREGRFRL